MLSLANMEVAIAFEFPQKKIWRWLNWQYLNHIIKLKVLSFGNCFYRIIKDLVIIKNQKQKQKQKKQKKSLQKWTSIRNFFARVKKTLITVTNKLYPDWSAFLTKWQ